MCGIIGYNGNGPAVGILLTGLEKLEYRGYDSAGIAVFQNERPRVVKTEGLPTCVKKSARRSP